MFWWTVWPSTANWIRHCDTSNTAILRANIVVSFSVSVAHGIRTLASGLIIPITHTLKRHNSALLTIINMTRCVNRTSVNMTTPSIRAVICETSLLISLVVGMGRAIYIVNHIQYVMSNELLIFKQDSAGQMSDMDKKAEETVPAASSEPKTEMTNILSHIKKLEESNCDLKTKLEDALQRNGKLSQKTREGMQSALDTLMKKWMDAVETKDGKVKDDFKCGLEKLVKNSAEDNGVWQMMVSASSLYERQEHDLEKLRIENVDLKQRVDGMYGSKDARVVGDKRAADEQMSREDVAPEQQSMWDDFAKSISGSAF